MLIDTHAHLNFPEFAGELDAVLKRASEAGVERMRLPPLSLEAVRELTGLGLKEAKDVVDGAPKAVKEGINKADAEAAKKKLEDAGGKAEIK